MKTTLTLLLTVAALVAVAQQQSQTKKLTRMEQQIVQPINAIFGGADEHNWNKVQSAMAPQVTLDYASLSGNPAATLSSDEIVAAWKGFLPGFDKTQHQIHDFQITRNGNVATAHFQGTAHHIIGQDTWTVSGTYDVSLRQLRDQWVVDKLKFNMTNQTGNLQLPAKAAEVAKKKMVRNVEFLSEGLILKGNLYLPAGFDANRKYRALIVTGSWTSIKEQMAGLYAKKLADKGFVALAFDFRYWGESEGQPRQYENPTAKIQDIKNAAKYLSSLPFVDADELSGLGICASAGYMAYAAAEDTNIKNFVSVAAWLHDKTVAKMIYDNWPDKYDGLISKGNAAAEKFGKSGEVDFVLATSETDANAAMYVPNGIFPYYLDKNLGAIPQYTNRFAVMSWPHWLQFDGVAAGVKLNKPVYMVHSEKAALPDGTRTFFAQAKGEKKITWLNEFNQMEFYYREQAVNKAVDQVSQWLIE